MSSTRQRKKVRQQVYATLGRLDGLRASGQREGLIRSELHHCEKLASVDAHAAGQTETVGALHIGPERIFGQLWQESGIQRVIGRYWQAVTTSPTLEEPFISRCCMGSVPAAATGPQNVGV